MNKCGIYKITNTINNKIYIGRSLDIDRRWRTHINDLSNGKHINKRMQIDWKLFGQSVFLFEIVKICKEEELNFAELEEIFRVDESKLYNNSTFKDRMILSMINEGYKDFKIDYKNPQCADTRPLKFNLVVFDEDLNKEVYVSVANTDYTNEHDEAKNQIKREYVDAAGGIMIFLEHSQNSLFRLTS